MRDLDFILGALLAWVVTVTVMLWNAYPSGWVKVW